VSVIACLLATSDLRVVLAEFAAKKLKNCATSIDYPDSLAATNAESPLDFCPKESLLT